MIDKEIIAKALVEAYTPMELAMKIIEAEEYRVNEMNHQNTLCSENMYLREWCEFLKGIVWQSIGKDGVDERA
jgi:hypothetical protein